MSGLRCRQIRLWYLRRVQRLTIKDRFLWHVIKCKRIRRKGNCRSFTEDLIEIMKLRIKFKKYGPVRFIGHLDVMRFFQKANRRAELDVAYTGGFSPHQIMSFAAPLGVGLTSNGEYMDLEVHSMTSCEDVKTRLNAASVPGIEITSVKILPDKAGNAMASVAAAGYTVVFWEGRGPHFDLVPAVEHFLTKDEILITKETKKGSREINLKEGIYEMKVVENGRLYLLVDASSAGNIKPIQVVEALFTENNESLMENALMVNREETYLRNDAGELLPLDAIGFDTEEDYKKASGDAG